MLDLNLMWDKDKVHVPASIHLEQVHHGRLFALLRIQTSLKPFITLCTLFRWFLWILDPSYCLKSGGTKERTSPD